MHDKVGLVQAANTGTLFLDEIADLPLSMQVKLLRVIQEQAIRPVGSAKEESVNVRILSATHQNLAAMVKRGDFREDLFYRINVIELHVPALRDRGDDILLLAGHILQRLGSSIDALDDGARVALRSYGFPGNVRELENMLERAVTLCAGGSITAGDLALRADSSDAQAVSTATDLGDQIDDVQRQAIVDALEKTRYNKTAAAETAWTDLSPAPVSHQKTEYRVIARADRSLPSAIGAILLSYGRLRFCLLATAANQVTIFVTFGQRLTKSALTDVLFDFVLCYRRT